MQVDHNHPSLSPEFLLHLSQEDFGNKLKETKTVHPDFRSTGFISLKEFSELTPVQKVALSQLMDQKRVVRDSEANHYFTTTISEMIAKIKEFIKEIDPLTDPEIELVGSVVASILESDPKYFERFANNLLSESDVPSLPNPAKSYNDIDIRVKLEGWDKKKRARLSDKLLAFYVEQTKSKSHTFFTHLVATEILRFKSIDLQRHIQRNIKACLDEERPNLSKNEIRRIKKLIIRSCTKNLKKLAAIYFEKNFKQINTTCVLALKEHFEKRIPIENPLINDIIQNLVRARIFNKIINLSDDKPSQYLVHSLGDMEYICHSKLARTHITTLDKMRISLPSGKIMPSKFCQCLIDHTIGVVRLDQEILEGIDFLKLISYYTTGESPAAPSDEQRAHESFHQALVQDSEFLEKFLKNHQSHTPLTILSFIYNCALALERINKPEDRRLFIEKVKSSVPREVQSGWEKFLLLLTLGAKYTFSDVNALLQTLCAIHLRKKIPTNTAFEFILRTDTQEPHFKILLRAQQRKSYLYSPFKPATSLRKTVELVKNPVFRILYCNLYQLILNDTKNIQLQILALAEEYSMTFGSPCLELWETILRESHQQPQYPHVLSRAQEIKLWKPEHLEGPELLKHAPTSIIIQKAHQLIRLGKDAGWEILQQHKDKFNEEHASELQNIYAEVCKQPASTRNLGWQLEQFKMVFTEGKFQPSTLAQWLLQGINKIIEISTFQKETHRNQQLANWLQHLFKNRYVKPNIFIQTIKEIYSKLRVDPKSTVHNLMESYIPSLLDRLRRSESPEEINALINECRLRSIVVPNSPEIIACHLEVCLHRLNKKPIPKETFPDLWLLLPSIFEARNQKYLKLIDDYLTAIFIKCVENYSLDFIIKFLSQNQETSIVRQCVAYLNLHLQHYLPTLLSKEPPLKILTLFNIPGINSTSQWSLLLDHTYEYGTEKDFTSLVKEFNESTKHIILTPQNITNLQDCWLTILDARRKFKSVNLENSGAILERLSNIFRGNLTVVRAYLDYLFSIPLSDNLLVKIDQHLIADAKLEEVSSLEWTWILLAATHPTLYKKVYGRIYSILDDSTTRNKQIDVDNSVMVILMSQKFVDKNGMEARKFVYDLYLKIKNMKGVTNLFPSIIDVLGRADNTALKELACDHFVYHLCQKVFPTNIDDTSLLQVLESILRKPLDEVEPHLSLLRKNLLQKNKMKKYVIPASLLLLHEWNSLMRHSDKPETIQKAVTFLENSYEYEPLCLTTNEFLALLTLYIKELCRKGLVQEHKQILDAYIRSIFRKPNTFKMLDGTTRIRQIMQVNSKLPTPSVIPAPTQTIKLADYRLSLARIYIHCASYSQTTTENAAYFFDAAYDNLMHYIQFDEISIGFHLLLEEFPSFIGIGHKYFKTFGLQFLLPIMATCNQKGIFDNFPEISLAVGIRYGIDSLVLAVNHPFNRLQLLSKEVRAANFESIFNPLFPEINKPEVRFLVYKNMIPMVNYVLRDNFNLYCSTFDGLIPYICDSLESKDKEEQNISIRLLCALINALISMEGLKKAVFVEDYGRICKRCLELLKVCIGKNNLTVTLDEFVIDCYLRLYIALQGIVYLKFDVNYKRDLKSFIRVLIPVSVNADEIKKFEDLIYKAIIAQSIVNNEVSKKMRAKLVIRILKLLNLLETSTNESQITPKVLVEMKTSSNEFLIRFFNHMVKNRIFENNLDLLVEATKYRTKAIENLKILKSDLPPSSANK